jgi:hypothetical protein
MRGATRLRRPLQLYLDSSDYSTFGTVLDGRATSEIEARYLALQALIKSGDVECRYSVLHVVEAAPTEQDFVDKAALRLTVMRDLSGKKVLRGPFDLAIPDVLSAYLDDEPPSLRPVDRKRFNARNDEGKWLPFLERRFAEIQDMMKRARQAPVDHALKHGSELAHVTKDSEEARRLRAVSKSPLAQMQYRQFFAAEWPDLFEKLRTEFVAREEDSDAWRDFVLGRISPEQMFVIWSESLSDLPRLAPLIGQNSGKIFSNVSAWFRKERVKLLEAYALAISMQQRVSRGEIGAELQGIMRDMERDQLKQFRLDIKISERARARSVITSPEFKAAQYGKKLPSKRVICQNNSLIEQLASVRCMAEVFASHFVKVASPFAMPRKPEKMESDPGDLLHASYIPYCDVFRCDSFSETYLMAVGKSFGTTIVSKQSALISCLQNQLAAATE